MVDQKMPFCYNMSIVSKQEQQMAYVSQELKAKLAPKVKAICKKYGVKASLAVRNHSVLCLNIKSGKIDFFADSGDCYEQAKRFGHIQVNTYWYHDHFSGVARDFLSEVIPAMHVGNHDRSDIQSDYFDVGWYVNVNVGQWNKPYTVDQ
jgi:hypothetical protein